MDVQLAIPRAAVPAQLDPAASRTAAAFDVVRDITLTQPVIKIKEKPLKSGSEHSTNLWRR
jgi:hypothetical protein